MTSRGAQEKRVCVRDRGKKITEGVMGPVDKTDILTFLQLLDGWSLVDVYQMTCSGLPHSQNSNIMVNITWQYNSKR